MGSTGDEDATGTDFVNIPLLDLRNFCQDELLLAAELSGSFPEARSPKLIIPTIDKNIFNTSLASWKQTYRRKLLTKRRQQSSSSAFIYQAAARLQILNPMQLKQLASKSKHHSLSTSKRSKLDFNSDVTAKKKKNQKVNSSHKSARSISNDSKSISSVVHQADAKKANRLLSNRSKSLQSNQTKMKSGIEFDSKSNTVNSRSGKDRREGLLQEPPQKTVHTAPQDAASSAVHHAPHLPHERMRLKDRARNMIFRQRQANQLAYQSTGEELPDAQRLSSSDPGKSSALPHMDMTGYATTITNPPEIRETDERELKNLCTPQGIGEVDAETYMLRAKDAWLSKHMEKTAFVAGGFSNGWDLGLDHAFRKAKRTGLP